MPRRCLNAASSWVLEEQAPIQGPLTVPGRAGTCPCQYRDHLTASAIPLAELEMSPAMGTAAVKQSGAIPKGKLVLP